MLILNRKSEEKIIIGDDIRMQIVRISGGQVRVGIEAPRDISVHREEVWAKLNRAKRAS